MLKFILILFVSMMMCDASVMRDSCSAPGIKEGNCVPLRECPSISTMSEDFNTLMTMERLNYLIGSYCGYDGKSAKVCCPLEELTTMKMEEATTSVQTMNDDNSSSEEMTTSNEIGDETTSSNEIM